MKWTKSYIAASILLLLFIITAKAKQPPADLGYDPPEGWEFVMKLDSASNVLIYCHNDSCFMYTQFAGGKPYIHDLTTDGGETWNKIPVMPIQYITFIKNTMTLHRVMLECSNFNYQKTADFYKTSEKYFICKSPYPEDTLYQSPIDPNILIATFKYQQEYDNYYSEDMFAMLSRDGGKTWERMDNLYRHPEKKSIYKYNFDWAEKGHWFVKAEDGEDKFGSISQISPPVYLETFDDGKSFRQIKFDPIIAYTGIQSKKTMFHFLYNKYRFFDSTYKTYVNYYTSKGIRMISYNDTIINSTIINWLNLIEPTKPMTNIDSGYIFTINQYYSKIFQFDYNNYLNQFIDAEEITGVDFQKEKVDNNQNFLSITKDSGNNWQIKNSLINRPRIRSTFLDQATKYIWIATFDEQYIPYKNEGDYKGSLWKYKLDWQGTSVENIQNPDLINIYPNPAKDYVEIIE
jgi:hypothetical protein